MKTTTKKQRKIQTRRELTAVERRALLRLAGRVGVDPTTRTAEATTTIHNATLAHLPAWRPRIPRSMRRLAKQIYAEHVDRLIAGMGRPCSRDEFYRRWPLMPR